MFREFILNKKFKVLKVNHGQLVNGKKGLKAFHRD